MDNMYEKITEILITSNKPSIEVKGIVESKDFKNCSLNIITELKNVEQNKTHHPEGNVWNHTMLVIDIAANLRELAQNKEAFMWASFLHDIGKKDTTKIRNGRITSYNHDNRSYELINDVLNDYNLPLRSIEEIALLAKYHMHHLYLIKDLPFKDIEGLIKNVCINDIILLFISDKLGRGKITKGEVNIVLNDVSLIIEKINLDMRYLTLINKAKEILDKRYIK